MIIYKYFSGNSYLIKNNTILIDGGFIFLKKDLILLSNLKYIMITHTHFDHLFSLAYILKNTDAKLILHNRQYKALKNYNLKDIPKPYNFYAKFLSFAFKLTMPLLEKYILAMLDINFLLSRVDKILYNKEENLEDMKIILIPGHSKDSIAIIYKDKCFVGDTLMNINFSSINPFPIFCNDKELLIESIKTLLKEEEIKEFYPAHGKVIYRKMLKNKLNI